MTVSYDAVLDLGGKVYDAALDEQKWPSFLAAFAAAVGGTSAILRSNELLNDSASFNASVGYDPAWQAAYCKHFVKVDNYNHLMNQYSPGRIFLSDRHIDQRDLRKTEYYNDYLRPQDKVHAFGTFLHKDDSHSLVLGIQRGKRAGAFQEEQVRLMNILAPHATRAVQVHRKLSSITVEKNWALGALDQLRMGVIMTDSLGVPLFANRAAEQMLAQGKGVDLCQGRMALNSTSETALLHKLIAGAVRGVPVGGDMRITLPDRVEYLQCLVTPVSPELSARLDIALGSGCAAIFLSRPGSLQLPPKRLAVLYGLSPAESRLAAKLAAFHSLEHAAIDLGIAIRTARTQLSAIFAKTGAKTQAELLMLLATGTLAHCREE